MERHELEMTGDPRDVYIDFVGELATHTQMSRDVILRHYYFYVFNEQWTLAVHVNPKMGRYLRVDGVWHSGERLKF